jgi:hypothetical protein
MKFLPRVCDPSLFSGLPGTQFPVSMIHSDNRNVRARALSRRKGDYLYSTLFVSLFFKHGILAFRIAIVLCFVLILSLKLRIKHSAWLYMLRFIATFLTNWYITPWQHNTSINRNKLWKCAHLTQGSPLWGHVTFGQYEVTFHNVTSGQKMGVLSTGTCGFKASHDCFDRYQMHLFWV